MRKRAITWSILVLLAVPSLAAAQYDPYAPAPRHRPRYGPGDTGLVLSGRLGIGFPGGDISHEGDPPLGDLVSSKIPIWLELGYRFNPAVWGGFYVELAPVQVHDAFCLPGHSCDGGSLRFGVDLQLHLAPYQRVDPWVGIGIGAEFLTVHTGLSTTGAGTADTVGDQTFSGLEFPLLEGGLELAASPRFSIGPYAALSLSRYSGVSTSIPGFADRSDTITDRAYHSWFQIGVKGTFRL